jgi:hypothetical protein
MGETAFGRGRRDADYMTLQKEKTILFPWVESFELWGCNSKQGTTVIIPRKTINLFNAKSQRGESSRKESNCLKEKNLCVFLFFLASLR